MRKTLCKINRKLNPWAGRRAEREAHQQFGDAAMAYLECAEHTSAAYDQLRKDVNEFADMFNDGMLASMVGGRFTCGEADALVRFFARVGREEVAELWLECHAEEDDDADDLHKTFDDEDAKDGTVVDLGKYLVELAA
ncbi:hypothetical protein [Kitasatospora sp. NBC_01302]|uniref:hypothetical protein n=1 Tax=Kitasatospora sp. NBC_01302 TaxID=2903575 RepID=UPI002E15CBC3|nr:hypothetical protein OG294_24745 [Kitasatospora sp. NBC_01302]